jgi:NAD(P)-dependent dehydrogenase (short-subunit alcohol dehydrogenase family)
LTDRAGPRLDGKTALVTGASSGLGRRFALVLARAGARVALAARRSEKLAELAVEIAAFDGRAIPIRLDVTDPASVQKAVDEAETELGPIDILINNSGISVQKRLADVTAADYDRVMDTNAKGAFFTAQEVAKRMIARGARGRIVNIASVAGLRPISQLSVYAMSKAAVVQMTRAMALEWGRHGININALCPGYIETEINRDYWPTEAGKKLIGMLPRRRVGRPENLDGILLLLSSAESEFINGAIIPVDDGLSAS